jgi:hypothetical protein
MRDELVSRYLERHAEPETQHCADQIKQSFDYCLVIPVYDETPACLADVLHHHPGTSVLTIAIINAPDNAPAQSLENTRSLLHTIAAHTPGQVLVVDCVSNPLPHKVAVGQARKIGTDIALALHQQGRIVSPWLYQTDADAVLPAGYFDEPGHDMHQTKGAVVFGHTHHSENQLLHRAAQLYDLHMHYYATSLAAAGSAYAYPTLGSTISVHGETYAAVRGYPKRNAAEDFYLLNKVAKVAGVRYLPDTQIVVAARTSHRVPFGTGPALTKIADGLRCDASGKTYLSYHPESFVLLRTTLNLLTELGDSTTDTFAVPTRIRILLNAIGFDRVEQTICAQYPPGNRRRQVLNEWFDAGKTLRFIHEARRFYPDQPLLNTVKMRTNAHTPTKTLPIP